MRPLVRLQRRRVLAPVAVDSQGTYDASHGTYDASESSLGKSLALSPRADAAPSPRVNSSSTISKFRRLTKHSSTAGLSWNGSAAAFVSTYDATFDGAASTSTFDANKASTSTFDGSSPVQDDLIGTFDGTTGSLSEPRSKTSRAPAGLLPSHAAAKGQKGSEASPRLDSARSVSSRGSCRAPLGRQLERRCDTFAHDLSLDMNATLERPGRMTSRRAGCDSARLSSVPSPRAGGDDVLTSTYEASKYVASSSTFDSSRTFDGNSPTSDL
jgi:hypothetical protein